MPNKYIIKGSVYDTDSSNSENKLLDNRDIITGDGLTSEIQADESVKITSDIGIKIVNGVPCVVYTEE